MLALRSDTNMSTIIYEDMENGDYGTFLGQKDRFKTPTTTPQYGYKKWLMLAILSVLTAINQGICYSYAPIASIVEKRWEERVKLITVYFISYIPCSFVGSWIMDKKGLLGEAYVTLSGQILASVAMPFMVNSPAVLSANWFPPQMRATSTSVAVNANAMGTAFVYLSAPFIVLSSTDVPNWNLYVALIATGAWVFALFLFRSFPRTGVAQSIISDVQLRDEYDWSQWATAFTHSGFWHTVVAFSVAECILNAMCALLGKFLSVAHFSKAQIGIVGSVFIISSLVGGQVISHAVNQAICYSYAPISTIVEARWEHQLHAETLITVFFISYIPTSFIGSWIMDQKSLAYGVVLGGLLQAAGASLRYFACFLDPVGELYVTLFGQLLASLAMPFMVNSPPLFSANWFPPSMRAVSTSVALNANALGTALVYLTAPFLVHSRADIPSWNLYIALLAAGSCVVAILFFRSTTSTRINRFSDNSKVHKYDWSQWWTAFSHTGFWRTIVAFSLAECIVNALSALLDEFLSVTTFSKTQIGFIGAAFIVSSLVGGQLVSQQVDKMRNHKTVALICLLLTAISIGAFQLVPKVKVQATLLSLLVLGAVLGPIQPIVLELGVECSYPTSEATVAALQQLCGNLLSAIAVPGLSALQRMHTDGYGSLKDFFVSPDGVMVLTTIATFIVFSSFKGKYKRSAHETKIVLPCINDDQVVSASLSNDAATFC
ncbi:hypothetical protein JG687_00011352 [Phytophthora cactorum]|uniref:Major facilitator superfamily domain n=1 Tax=Phytophthora cactorum TaxID=29920 RepID=A0A8T1U6R1_9STRA|nr:hypothetical protein JG687_00011352 [Phytophthora cactorum]